MDADLRWNGILKEMREITFFVKEFDFNSQSKYQTFLGHVFTDRLLLRSMKNTSFFTWSGKNISDEEVTQIFQAYRKLLKGSEVFMTEPEDQSGMKRISEQLALSIVSEWWGHQIGYLKETDGFRDGEFVESSYFGATGSEF
jgi:uncharacterized protein involved in tolerance to divalent cations